MSSRYAVREPQAPLRSLFAHALRACVREGYCGEHLRADLMAGVVVGVVALPLAMALGIAVGVAPQHGLYTAIVAGFVCAALGGSRLQVTGPTAAFIVILAPIQAEHGLAGLLVAGALGGVMLTVMGALRMGRLIQFIPHPVTTGFTAGIGTVIATLQLKDVFGLTLENNPQHFIDRVEAMWAARGTTSWGELVIALFTLALLLGVPRLTKRVPAPLVALPAAAVLAAVLAATLDGFHAATIAGRFTTTVGGEVIHGIPPLPPLPVLPWNLPGKDGADFVLNLQVLRALFPGAFAIAMLGAIESLLSAVVADGMARTRHEPDAEILSQGIGNILTPFFGGIPATGAIARTATNFRSGGRSPIASMVHAVTILAAVLALAPIIGYLPMASLAALLVLIAYNMSEIKHFVHTVKVAPRSDVAVLLTCYSLTVIFDMVIAVTVGVVLAALLFMRRMAEVTQAKLASDHAETVGAVPEGVVVYEIAGPLFFGTTQKAMGALSAIGSHPRAVILDMSLVPAMDSTGLVALESVLSDLKTAGGLTVIAGLQPQPATVLAKAHIAERPGEILFADTVQHALGKTREHLNGHG